MDWENKIKKDLKIDSIESLFWDTDYGKINPIKNLDQKLNTGKHSKFNEICWKFNSDNCTNKNILSHLSNGVNSININNCTVNQALFNNVMNDIIYNNITISDHLSNENQNDWIDWVNSNTNSKGSLRLDPISSSLINSLSIKESINTDLINKCNNEITNNSYRCLFVDATIYSSLFSDVNIEISHIISHINESIEIYKSLKIPLPKKLILKTAINADFVQQVSKIRALKGLIVQLFKAHKEGIEIKLECSYDESLLSPVEKENNLLRMTTAFLVAIICGANGIELTDLLAIKKGEYWQKIITNIPIILLEESQLNIDQDVIEGAHIIENISYKMAHSSWQNFKNIENKGGLLNYIRNGLFENVVKEQQEKKLSNIINKENKILGFNYFNQGENNFSNIKDLNIPFYLNDLK
jgi:hypothetical protein